jgi:hypothetical protein
MKAKKLEYSSPVIDFVWDSSKLPGDITDVTEHGDNLEVTFDWDATPYVFRYCGPSSSLEAGQYGFIDGRLYMLDTVHDITNRPNLICEDCNAPATVWGPMIVAMASFNLCDVHAHQLREFEKNDVLVKECQGARPQPLYKIVNGKFTDEPWIDPWEDK